MLKQFKENENLFENVSCVTFLPLKYLTPLGNTMECFDKILIKTTTKKLTKKHCTALLLGPEKAVIDQLKVAISEESFAIA